MGYHQINNVALFRTLHRYRGLKLNKSYCREISKPSSSHSSTNPVITGIRLCSSTARCNTGYLGLGQLASSHNNTYLSSSIRNSFISHNPNCYLKKRTLNFKPFINPTLGFHTTTTSFEEIRTIVVPPFADSVSEGDVRWEKGVGDFVKEDDVVAQIETDKTAISIPAPVSGVIEALLVEDGATVKAGQEIFKLKLTDDASAGSSKPVTASVPSPPTPTAAPPPSPPSPTAPPPPPTPSQTPSMTHTPQPSLHPKEVPPQPIPKTAPPSPPKPTEPLKKIPVPDIKMPPMQPVVGSKVPPTDFSKKIVGSRAEQRVKMNRMRLRIAERLKDAQNTNAMLTTFNEIDMSNIMELRKTYQDKFTKKYNIKLGFMSAFMKASAYALQHQPVVNAVIEGNEIIYRDYVDISVAVATPKGLVVPVVRGVESMDYADIELEIMRLGEKAKSGALAIEDMDGGTFTISNGGVFGSLFGTPIINPPQSAILGMHGVFERPVAIKGQVVVRPMMFIALTYDHRLIDGREAVTFLRTIKGAVEDPRVLLMGL